MHMMRSGDAVEGRTWDDTDPIQKSYTTSIWSFSIIYLKVR